MASVLRASREQRVQVQAVPEPRPPDGMTTSSTAPMPKALPRRPNLLALFPGISNDWRGAERYREAGRTRGEKERQRGSGRWVPQEHTTWAERTHGSGGQWGTVGRRRDRKSGQVGASGQGEGRNDGQ